MLISGLLLSTGLTAQNPAVIPVHRLGEQWWSERHERCVAQTKQGNIDVVFLGDSITQGWESEGKAAWDRDFAPLKAANFGFSGDRTEHVLWRLDNGEMSGLDAKVVVLMIGTNNIGHGSSTPSQTADGVRLVVSELQERLPQAKILLLAIFPRDEAADGALRIKANEATNGFKNLHDGKRVFFKDIGPYFVHSSGRLRTNLMPDRLHLSSDGYEIWARAIRDDVRDLLGK